MSVLEKSNEGKQLSIKALGVVYNRYPVQTPTIMQGNDLSEIFEKEVGDFLQDGDIVLVAESIVAISEGRAFKFSEIKYCKVAEFLSRFVTKTPYGIGLGTPQTMQLAINEAGLLRILFATFIAGVTRPFGIKGMFYRLAGARARGIDGPTSATLPPYNNYASLIPQDPRGFALKMQKSCLPKEIEFIVIDANDIGVNILGFKDKEQERLGEALAKDNPMGQSDESTPFLICRKA